MQFMREKDIFQVSGAQTLAHFPLYLPRIGGSYGFALLLDVLSRKFLEHLGLGFASMNLILNPSLDLVCYRLRWGCRPTYRSSRMSGLMGYFIDEGGSVSVINYDTIAWREVWSRPERREACPSAHRYPHRALSLRACGFRHSPIGAEFQYRFCFLPVLYYKNRV